MTVVFRYRQLRAPRELSAQPLRTLRYPRRKGDVEGSTGSDTAAKSAMAAKGAQLRVAYDDNSAFADLSGDVPKSGSKQKRPKKAGPPAAITGTPMQRADALLSSQRAVPADRVNSRIAFLDELVAFSSRLDDVEGKLSGADALALLKDWKTTGKSTAAKNDAAMIMGDDRWPALRVAVGDTLIAVTLLRQPQRVEQLVRLFRAIGLIEALAVGGDALPAETVAALYMDRIVILPEWLRGGPGALKGGMSLKSGSLAPGAGMLVRSPAFSDHVVVREEWSCYVPGEIAHVENVLRGERKTREHRRLSETETTELLDRSTLNLTEHNQQTTERNSLQEEASSQTQVEIGVEGQVDVAAQYGPTSIATHFGGSVNFSSSEARRKASEQSQEIVSRSIERVESNVREARTTRTLTQVKEINGHLIDNSVAPSGHVVGVYRWLDKINRLQLVRYRHRFVLEFEVPEPAAYLRWLATKQPPPAVNVEPPPPFTNTANNPLKPSDIDRNNYAGYVAKFKATGVVSPPDDMVFVTAAKFFSSDAEIPNNRNAMVEVPPSIVGSIEVAVPKDYEAASATFSMGAVPALFKWHDQEETAGDKYMSEKLGYHVVVGAFTFSGAVLKLVPPVSTTVRSTSGNSGVPYRDAWTTVSGQVQGLPSGGAGTGTVSAGVSIGGTYRATVSLRVHCVLQANVMDQWRLDVYDRLRAAHSAAEAAYREAKNAAEVRAGITFTERSPLRNAEIVREELKRQVIEMLIGARFDGIEGLEQPVDAARGPSPDFPAVAASAPLIQFLEQAFEWGNMTYVLYPYFWTSRERWPMLQPQDGADPAFVRFLRSGSARIALPARPGFEWAVIYYNLFGVPWLGGAPPIPDDPLYVSVAQEIQEQMSGPDEGEPGDMWEVKLPTTLVWIDPDPGMPKCNTARRLIGTPLIDLCGDACNPAPAPNPP